MVGRVQVRASVDTILNSRKEFLRGLNDVFGAEYLDLPDDATLQASADEHERAGFPGCFGSIDCKHLYWARCPYTHRGSFLNKDKRISIVMQAIALRDLSLRGVFIGRPGSNNDLQVLDK